MAPPLQPWPLYRICLSASSSLVDQVSCNTDFVYVFQIEIPLIPQI